MIRQASQSDGPALQARRLDGRELPLILLIGLPLALKSLSVIALVLLMRLSVNLLWAVVLAELLVICAPATVFLILCGGERARFGLFRPRPAALVAATLLGLCLGLAGVGLGNLLYELIPDWLAGLLQLEADRMLSADSGWELALLLAGLGLLGPLGEELLFRGLIQRNLALRMSLNYAVLLGAALFAGFHLNPLLFLPLFGLGCAFGWLAGRHGLWPAAAAHCAYNLVVLAAVNCACVRDLPLSQDLLSLAGGLLLSAGALVLTGRLGRTT